MSGEFTARIAQLMVVDRQSDIIMPGAFGPPREVPVGAWNHSSVKTAALPVGRATIEEDGRWAIARGVFFLDTEAGRQTYATVKALGALQEWSFAFFTRSSRPSRNFPGATELLSLETYEVSPVLIGAGIDTTTLSLASGAHKHQQLAVELEVARFLGVRV